MGIGEPILYIKYFWIGLSLITIYNRVINSSFRHNKFENEKIFTLSNFVKLR